MANAEQTDLERLRNLHSNLGDLIKAHEKGLHVLSQQMLWAEWEFFKALIDWTGGYDPQDMFEDACRDLRVDEDGVPVDANGEPLRTFNPSRVHPDNPCQSGGLSA